VKPPPEMAAVAMREHAFRGSLPWSLGLMGRTPRGVRIRPPFPKTHKPKHHLPLFRQQPCPGCRPEPAELRPVRGPQCPARVR